MRDWGSTYTLSIAWRQSSARTNTNTITTGWTSRTLSILVYCSCLNMLYLTYSVSTRSTVGGRSQCCASTIATSLARWTLQKISNSNSMVGVSIWLTTLPHVPQLDVVFRAVQTPLQHVWPDGHFQDNISHEVYTRSSCTYTLSSTRCLVIVINADANTITADWASWALYKHYQ